jgi:RHS repeat-associated protein
LDENGAVSASLVIQDEEVQVQEPEFGEFVDAIEPLLIYETMFLGGFGFGDSFEVTGEGRVGGFKITRPATGWDASGTLTFTVSGPADYGVDYTLSPSGAVVLTGPDNNGQFALNVSTNPSEITITVTPLGDTDETDTEQVVFTFDQYTDVTKSIEIVDYFEDVSIAANPAHAAENGPTDGAFVISAPDGILAEGLVLLIDANLSHVPNAATPGEDYLLYRTDLGGETLVSPSLLTDGIYHAVLDSEGCGGNHDIVVVVRPVQDQEDDENVEAVVAYVAPSGLYTIPDRSTFGEPATITIEDLTTTEPPYQPIEYLTGEVELHAKPDPEASCTSCACGACPEDRLRAELADGSFTYSSEPVTDYMPQYQSTGTHNDSPIVRAKFQFPSNHAVPTSVTVKAKIDGSIIGQPQSYSVSNFSAGDEFAIAVQLDLSGQTPDASYAVELTVTPNNSNAYKWTVTTPIWVRDNQTSSIAPGWSFEFLNRLQYNPLAHASGAMLFRGDGSMSFYQGTSAMNDDGSEIFLTPEESLSDLTYYGTGDKASEAFGSNVFVLRHRFGHADVYPASESGVSLLSKHYDRNGNVTEFEYDSNDRLESVTDAFGRTTTYDYTIQGIDLRITDFAGRITDYVYDPSYVEGALQGKLTITYPDPDGPTNEIEETGFKFSPVEEIFYQDGRLKKIRRSGDDHFNGRDEYFQEIVISERPDQVTTINYSSIDHRLASIVRPDGSTWTLEFHRQRKGLETPLQVVGEFYTEEVRTGFDAFFENQAKVVDGRNNATIYELDRRGRVLKVTDAHEQEFTYQLWLDEEGNDRGEILVVEYPDADDFSNREDLPLEWQANQSTLGPTRLVYTYDDSANVTSMTLQEDEDSNNKWTKTHATTYWDAYNDTFDIPAKITNELGQVTEYEIDPSTGNIEAIEWLNNDSFPGRFRPGSPWQNEYAAVDVDRDGTAAPIDALAILDALNEQGVGPLGDPPRQNDGTEAYLDVNGDNLLSPIDALEVINYLNQLLSSGSYEVGTSNLKNAGIQWTYTTHDDGLTLPNGLVLTETTRTGRADDREIQYTYFTNPSEIASFGRISTITYSSGETDAVYRFTYDDHGNIASIEDPLGDGQSLDHVTEYLYDNVDRLIQINYPSPDGFQPGPVTEFDYDAFGNVKRMTETVFDPLAQPPEPSEIGLTTCFYHDGMNRLTWMIEPHPTDDVLDTSCDVSPPTSWFGAASIWPGRPVTYNEYDGNGNLTLTTDPRNRTTEFSYDALNHVIQIVEPHPLGSHFSVSGEQLDGGCPVTKMYYDNVGNLWLVDDALGNKTFFYHDAQNRLKSIVEWVYDAGITSRSTQINYEKSSYGWRQIITDADQTMTEMQYDRMGQLRYVVQPEVDGELPITWYDYYLDGSVRAVYDPLGNRTLYERDGFGQATGIIEAEVDGSSAETTFEYDLAGQLISMTDARGYASTYSFDNLGRMWSYVPPDPDGGGSQYISAEEVYTYDGAGNLVQVRDVMDTASTFRAQYTYDRLGRMVEETDALGQVTEFSYNLVGEVTSITDPNDNTTSWQYDGLGRVYQETDELNNDRTSYYDAVGNLRKYTDGLGRVIAYDYDTLYRMSEEQWFADEAAFNSSTPDREISYAYDIMDNLLGVVDDESATYVFAYDDIGRVTSVGHILDSLASSVQFFQDYDVTGNRVSLAATVAGTDDFLNTYAYDARSRMVSITQTGQIGGNTVAAKHVTFDYNDLGQFNEIARYAAATADANQMISTSDFTYDQAARLTGLTHENKNGYDFADYDFVYDNINRITQVTSLRDGDAVYTYDDRDQLASTTYTGMDPIPTESYTYDDNGNRMLDATNSQSGDNTDNRVQTDGVYNYGYDAEGNRTTRTHIASSAVTEYVWDHRNRLVSITDKNASGTVTKTVAYVYDPFDRRIGKTVDPDGPGGESAWSEIYVYDGDHIALVFDDADGPGGNAATLAHRMLHGPAVDMILADEDLSESPTAFDRTRWALTDQLGTVRDVIDSNPGGTTIDNHIRYDSFGGVFDETDPSVDFLFGFTGRERDEESDLNYYRARYYDPELGRFISKDPIGFAAGDVNQYRYVGNGPVEATDPSGLQDFGLPPWNKMPTYSPDQGWLDFNAGNNSGNTPFRRWIADDPRRASDFIQGVYDKYHGKVQIAARHYGVSEFLIYTTIIPEVINFSWADYYDFGASKGPGQLTPAIINYYGVGREVDNLCESQQNTLGPTPLPWRDRRAMKDILQKASILDMQLREIELAAKGGGKLVVGDKRVIDVPAMSKEFIEWAGGIKDANALSRPNRVKNPAAVKDFFGNGMPVLVAMLISMNRNNPGATGNPSGMHQYEGRQGIVGPQSQIGYSLTRSGYFRCDNSGRFNWGSKE